MPEVEELRRYAAGNSDAYMYTRYSNPTVRVAEEKLAALEGAEDCVVTSSGMSAILSAVMAVCSAGDEIVSMLDIYGGTLKLFEKVLTRFNVMQFRGCSTIEIDKERICAPPSLEMWRCRGDPCGRPA